MCESHVYVREEENEILIMDDAVCVEPVDGGVTVEDASGREIFLEGTLQEVSFLNHTVIISR